MKIIPSTFREHPNASPGERNIFRQLKNSRYGDDWIVLHNLEILREHRIGQTEADFIFLIPGLGVLVLEVKACRTVSFDETGWMLGNKHDKRGPFKQASDAMHAIIKYLAQEGIEKRDTPIVFAVWFTEIPRKEVPSSISWHAEQVLTKEDCGEEITSVLSATLQSLIPKLNMNFPELPAPQHRLEKIADSLAPMFQATQAPADRQREIKESLDTALESQLEMIKIVTQLRAIVIQGMAGTGKTYLAVQIAKQAAVRDETVLFICYNNMLAKYIQKLLSNFHLIRVTTIHALMLEVSEVEVPSDANHEWWSGALPFLAMAKIDQYRSDLQFDHLVIDEAQDIGNQEYLLFMDQVLKGGFANGRVTAFGDFDHQGVFGPGKEALQEYQGAVPNIQILNTIRTNCRNTRQVGDFISTIMELDPGYESYRRRDADGEVKIELTDNESGIASALKSHLPELLKKYTPDQIVILSAQGARLSSLLNGIKGQFVELRSNIGGKIRFGTVQEFKGLEALAVILIEFEGFNPRLKETFYIGATRSLHDVVLIIPETKISGLSEGEDEY